MSKVVVKATIVVGHSANPILFVAQPLDLEISEDRFLYVKIEKAPSLMV
jgi:hypothetical protein